MKWLCQNTFKFVMFFMYMGVGVACAVACDVNWQEPVNYFDGVDKYGYVAYSEVIGELDMGDGFKMPVVIDFSSNREFVSPYLGHGWLLPLLDSNIVQTNENKFCMTRPDGQLLDFERNDISESILEGGGGWKARIASQNIDVWAECGWKLRYIKGKIVSITTPKNRNFSFIYQNGKVVEIRDASTTLLQIYFNEQTASRTLIFNKQRVELVMGKRALVQVIDGHRLIQGTSLALSQLKIPVSAYTEYVFSVNDNVQPTLEIAKEGRIEGKFVWDAATKRISADRDWVYTIKPSVNPTLNAAIYRINANGQSQYWFDDSSKNEETIQGVDGITTVTKKFSSGVLNGAISSVVQVKNGNSTVIQKPIYDENGNKLLETQGDFTLIYSKKHPGSVVKILQGKKVIFEDGKYR